MCLVMSNIKRWYKLTNKTFKFGKKGILNSKFGIQNSESLVPVLVLYLPIGHPLHQMQVVRTEDDDFLEVGF